jgi:hypothetical protein
MMALAHGRVEAENCLYDAGRLSEGVCAAGRVA